MKDDLRAAVTTIDNNKLGFTKYEVGTHSLCSGAAMAMHLSEEPVYIIMIIGCWSSDVFLRYIRKQVAQFSQNITKRMISSQYFTHVPTFDRCVSILDPRQCNHVNNDQTRLNVVGKPLLSSRLPTFAIWT